MSNVSKCFLCAHKNDYDPKFGYYGCKLSGQECKGYSMLEPKAKPKPITNADRIRSMTDEELAAQLFYIAQFGGGFSRTEEWYLNWLRQEVDT